MMSKEQEEQQRAYIPPDYSEAERLCPKEEDDEDIEDVDLEDEDDDDDDFDEEEEEDDPAESEELLEKSSSTGIDQVFPPSSTPRFGTFNPQPRNQPIYNNNNQQRNMATPTWPGTPSGSQGGFGGYGASQQPTGWGPKPGGGWGNPSGTTPGWGTPVGGQKETLDRKKKIIFCDVLDCLVTTPESGNRLGVVPRGIYDIQLRLDVWAALRRFGNLERIYAMIPKSLILSSSGEDSWMSLLNYIACALSEFLKVPSSACQILTQSYVVQPKADMIKSVLGDIDTDDAVYIGTQSGGLGQSSIDLDAANEVDIDYIDLGQFMTIYQ